MGSQLSDVKYRKAHVAHPYHCFRCGDRVFDQNKLLPVKEHEWVTVKAGTTVIDVRMCARCATRDR